MSKTAKGKTLIAKWTIEQDASMELPSTVRWSDGSPATNNDYLIHMLDTHTWVESADGMQMRMYPDVIADLHYSRSDLVWMLNVTGLPTVALDLTDPHAPDDQITAELYT